MSTRSRPRLRPIPRANGIAVNVRDGVRAWAAAGGSGDPVERLDQRFATTSISGGRSRRIAGALAWERRESRRRPQRSRIRAASSSTASSAPTRTRIPSSSGGDPPHRLDQPLTEPGRPARQVPHSPARVDIAQRDQDSRPVGGDQNLDRQTRGPSWGSGQTHPWRERLAHRCTVTAARPSIRDRSGCVCWITQTSDRRRRPVVTQRHLDRASLLEVRGEPDLAPLRKIIAVGRVPGSRWRRPDRFS